MEDERPHDERTRTLLRKQEEFTAFIVHDLRNPLASILANVAFLSDVLADSPRAAPDVGQALTDLRVASCEMARILADVRDLGRGDAGALVVQLRQVDLPVVIDEARSRLADRLAEMRQGLEIHVAAELPRISADGELLRRLVENLLDNAIRFSPAASQLGVTITVPDPSTVLLTVSDEASPIPEAERVDVFDAYVRSASGSMRGKGLGLAFCRLAAEAHGGRIRVEPRGARGNLFSVVLPVRGA